MRILDLFCGAGGAAMGLHRAGLEVVGVDINPQPNYPFEFHQADALDYPLEGFDAYWASPPCQRYSTITAKPEDHADYYGPIRNRFIETGKPYIIENVIGAPYNHGIVLCGSMFNLSVNGEWLRRHRNFETSWMLWQPRCIHPSNRRCITVTGKAFTSDVKEYKHNREGPYSLACELMGIDWMSRGELPQAIPPAYSEYLGNKLLEYAS